MPGLADFTLIGPELALLVLAVVVLGADLIWRERVRAALPYVCAAGLVVPAALAAGLAGRRETAFLGTLVVDDLATAFKLIILLAAALVALSSVGYLRRRSIYLGEYLATLIFSTLGMVLLASANELVTIFVALELTSISLYLLAAFIKDDPRSTEAGIKYLVLGALASALLVYGFALFYGLTGTTMLPDIASRLANDPRQPVLLVALVMVVAGFGFKVAAVPFQFWVPDVYEGAPTPTTAFISVASKAAGFVILLRFLSVALAPVAATWTSLFALLAAATMTFGNIGALRQTNIKRLLGYSSIAQAGYALMALATVDRSTAASLVFFVLAYAVTNLGMFAAVSRASEEVGSDELGAYAGLSGRSPWLAGAMLVCLLSLVGMPPLAGFWSKVYLFLSVFGQGQVLLVIVALLNTALAAFYYLKVARAVFLLPAPAGATTKAAVDRPLALALGIAVVAVLVVGLAPDRFLELATVAAASLR